MHTCIHPCMHACIHAYIHPCMHACIHTYIQTHIHAYIHPCIQTHTHTTTGKKKHDNPRVFSDMLEPGCPCLLSSLKTMWQSAPLFLHGQWAQLRDVLPAEVAETGGRDQQQRLKILQKRIQRWRNKVGSERTSFVESLEAELQLNLDQDWCQKHCVFFSMLFILAKLDGKYGFWVKDGWSGK